MSDDKRAMSGDKRPSVGDTDCPIGLDKVHCQNCHFWRGLYPNGHRDYLSLKFRIDRQRPGGRKGISY